MHATRDIKNYGYQYLLLCYFVLNVTLHFFLSGSPVLEHMGAASDLLEKGLVVGSVFVILKILDAVVPSDIKAILVFWRTQNPLPGSRVFTSLLHRDPRISESVLVSKYGALPVDPKEQNHLWYRIFKSYESDSMIFQSHKSYLLLRDLTSHSAVLFLISIVGVIASKTVPLFSVLLVLQYVLLSLAGRNSGVRFVLNVLAKDSAVVQQQGALEERRELGV